MPHSLSPELLDPVFDHLMNQLRSKSVALSPNRGFRVPENTFSLMSVSTQMASDPLPRGRRFFRIPPTLPLVTRALSPSVVLRSSLP